MWRAGARVSFRTWSSCLQISDTPGKRWVACAPGSQAVLLRSWPGPEKGSLLLLDVKGAVPRAGRGRQAHCCCGQSGVCPRLPGSAVQKPCLVSGRSQEHRLPLDFQRPVRLKVRPPG